MLDLFFDVFFKNVYIGDVFVLFMFVFVVIVGVVSNFCFVMNVVMFFVFVSFCFLNCLFGVSMMIKFGEYLFDKLCSVVYLCFVVFYLFVMFVMSMILFFIDVNLIVELLSVGVCRLWNVVIVCVIFLCVCFE